MYDIEHFRKSQEDLLKMIEELQSLMATDMFEMSQNAMTAYQVLCDLGFKIHAHLGEADRYVYPYLLIHDDPRVQSLAWGFINGENPLRQTFADYYLKWLNNFHFIFPQDFIADSQEIFNMIIERIDRENKELLPWLAEIGINPHSRVQDPPAGL